MADKKKNPVTEGKKSFNWPDKIFGAAVLILSILVFLMEWLFIRTAMWEGPLSSLSRVSGNPA